MRERRRERCDLKAQVLAHTGGDVALDVGDGVDGRGVARVLGAVVQEVRFGLGGQAVEHIHELVQFEAFGLEVHHSASRRAADVHIARPGAVEAVVQPQRVHLHAAPSTHIHPQANGGFARQASGHVTRRYGTIEIEKTNQKDACMSKRSCIT